MILNREFFRHLILFNRIPVQVRRFWGALEIGNSLRHKLAEEREEKAYVPPAAS